jgi:hypothetical protein
MQRINDVGALLGFFLVFYAWKCINCGAVIDRTIAANRRKSVEAKIEELKTMEAAVVE